MHLTTKKEEKTIHAPGHDKIRKHNLCGSLDEITQTPSPAPALSVYFSIGVFCFIFQVFA